MTPQPPERGAPEPVAWVPYITDEEFETVEDGVMFDGDGRLKAYWTEAEAREKHPIAGGPVVPLYTLDTALAAARERIVGELEAEAGRWEARGPSAHAMMEEIRRGKIDLLQAAARLVRQGGRDG